jgi:prepilin-type N-terminal cleavage/methylation domain-containing protein
MSRLITAFRNDRSRLASDDSGFTIIEVIVAMMVFAIVAVCVASALTNGIILTNNSRDREAAVNLASQDIDGLRMKALGTSNGVFQVTSTVNPIPTPVGGVTYYLDRNVDWVTTTGGVGSCGTGTGTLAYKSVTDTVSWAGVGRASNHQSIQMTTLIAPISNINSDTAGTIIVAVIGASGAAEPGVTINVTPNTGGGGTALTAQPAKTDSDGCSFALNVAPGTYTVTATLTGGIDFQQHAPASNASVVVAAGQNTLVNFTYDLAGTFPLSYPGGASVATNMPVTFTNPVGGTPQFKNAPTSVSAFPFGDGYRMIAGTYIFAAGGGSSTCVDTDPASWPTSTVDGAIPVPDPAVPVSPGKVAPSTGVPMGLATVSGFPNNSWLTAVSATPPTGSDDPGCPATQTLTFPQSSSSSQTIALPYGTWSIYYGSSKGAKTTNIVSTHPTWITLGTRGSVDSTTTKTFTLDPRVVPGP